MNQLTIKSSRVVTKKGILSFILMAIFSCQQQPAIQSSTREWVIYSGDYSGSKYSELEQINRNNVQKLEVEWIYRSKDNRENPRTTIECNPVVVDGIIYLTTPGLKLAALDAAKGIELWQFDPFKGQAASGVNRGVTYWSDSNDKRIFYVAGSNLYSLNAVDGRPVLSFGDSGKVDLRKGLDRDIGFLGISATSPGIIYEDLFIIGSALPDGAGPVAPGHVRAYDVYTGKRRWIFHTIPHPGEDGYQTWPADAWKRSGGTNAWGGFTLDTKRQLVFFGTGSPAYDHYGGDRIGQNLFGNCIIALHVKTGKLAWYYQVVHHDLWDYDLPCPPNLVTIEKNGKKMDAIAQATKMGHLFVLERETGKPIYPIKEIAVPQSDLPGEETWPTQPFPDKALRYAQQRFTETEAADLSPESNKQILQQLQKMRQGEIFLPPGLDASVVLPQFNGGTDWGGAAFDIETNILYVNSSNEAEWISMVESKTADDLTVYDFGEKLYQAICSGCHGYENPVNPGSPRLKYLKKLKEDRKKREVLDILNNGKGQMPSFKMFPYEEKKAILAFLFNEGKDRTIDSKRSTASYLKQLPFVSTGHRVFKDSEGFPVNQRPWGTLSAIDLNTGKIIWAVPLGTYPQLEKKGYPPTGTFNMGGAVVTAGGLVFIGAAMDERFHAYDKTTGELLWEFQLDAGGYATPATYEVDKKQYIVIAAGGGGKPETKSGDAYYCFSLPDFYR